ncbi:MAG: type II toxin-antitoxin system VapC family toxin [Actinomycetota bacterium]|nr:type II toxin-antitoxin system VapC family toxin [Actinomycetota bacterium]
MRVVDANVLIHAVNLDAAEHVTARSWLEHRLSGPEGVGLAWVALLAFVRIVTRPDVLEAPLTPQAAFDYVEEWLACPPVTVLHPTARHLAVLRGLVEPVGTAGNLTSDAHLAALAVEHGAYLVSFDRDFGRFPGLAWRHPADDLSTLS